MRDPSKSKTYYNTQRARIAANRENGGCMLNVRLEPVFTRKLKRLALLTESKTMREVICNLIRDAREP